MGYYLFFGTAALCQEFLGARAPLELANVKKNKNKKKNEKVSNSNNLLSSASTCTLILNRDSQR